MLLKYKLDFDKLKKIDNFTEFDEEFTIKVHNKFKSAIKYYNKASCLS